MKLQIKKEKLERGIVFGNKITQKKFSLPILDYFLFEAKENILKIHSTNLESGLIWQGLAKVEKEGKCCLNKKIVSNLISFLPEEKIIEIEAKEGKVIFSSENFYSKLNSLDPEDFPIIPQPKHEPFINLETEDLTLSLRKVIHLVSPSIARPEISGVLFKILPSEILIVGTDSFRLGEKKIFQKNPIEKEFSFILPQQAAKEISTIFSDEGRIKLYFSSSQVFLEIPSIEGDFPEVLFTSRLIEGEYPNYKEVIPKKFETEAKIDREWFLNLIKAASVFCGRSNEISLKFNPEKMMIEISSQNQETGEFKTEMPAEIKGREIKIAFNFKFLLEGVLGLQEKEFIFQLIDSENPAILSPVETKDYFYVLMPIKT